MTIQIIAFRSQVNIVFLYKLRKTDDTKYINAVKFVETTKKRLSANANYDMCIDNLLLQLWRYLHEGYNRRKI